MKDLILKSLDAHKRFVTSKMRLQNAVYYKEIYNIVNSLIRSNDNYFVTLATLEAVLNQLRISKLLPNDELKYKKLAIAHINEVILVIVERFSGKLR